MINSSGYVKAAHGVLAKLGIDCDTIGLYQRGDRNHTAFAHYLFSRDLKEVELLAEKVSINIETVRKQSIEIVCKASSIKIQLELDAVLFDFVYKCQMVQQICIWLDDEIREGAI